MLSITARVGVVAPAALLLLGTLAGVGSAAPVDIDVAGHATVHTIILSASTPGDVVATAIAPSSVALDVADAGAVTLLGGSLHYQTFVSLGIGGVLGSVETDEILALPAGAVGTLTGDEIAWSELPIYGSLSGTITCTGLICTLVGLPPGVPVPIGSLPPYVYFPPITEGFLLGTWVLSAGHDQIVGSTRMIVGRSPPGSGNPPPGEPTRWVVLGDSDLGFPVPEPGASALVLVAAGSVGLKRSGRAFRSLRRSARG